MRRIVLMFFAVLPLVVVAQTKKVAVMETKRMTDEVTMIHCQLVRGGLETAVANASGYEGYDRTSFDDIMREQKFQRSGAVNESEIRKMGEMAGVQYIVVSEATNEGGDFYILVKMLDVETGKYGAAYDALCLPTGQDIRKACAELGAKLFGTRVGSSYSQTGGNTKVASSYSQNVGNKNFVGTEAKRILVSSQYYEILPSDLDGKYTWEEAMSACANLTAFGKSDWYLPTKEELNVLYRRKGEIGGFANDWYWSSSEYDSYDAYKQRFSDGYQNLSDKEEDYYVLRVRCVRKN